jgi:hypothetical protein
MIPRPEVYVKAGCEGDFRDEAAFACLKFRNLTGRLPNYVAVTLAMVEGLEDAYPGFGPVDACNPPGVPLFIVDGLGLPLPPMTTLRLPAASDRIEFEFVQTVAP